MPGVVSLLDFHARPDRADRFRRLHAATRLKPDYQLDAWQDPDGVLALGRTNLGVLNRPAQPLVSPDRRFRLCFHGEFYDLDRQIRLLRARGVPLSGTDHGDLLLGTYQADGLDGVARLNGSYFFVLWDAEVRRLIVGGDRYGSRPHYYSFHDGRFVLAPDLAAILASRDDLPAYALSGIFEFLALEYPLADHTFFEGIQVFPPGTFLVLAPGDMQWLPYWRIEFTGPDEPVARKKGAWFDEAVFRYRQAVARTMIGDVGVPLSGGIDSRVIVALSPRRDYPVLTFGDADSDDVVFSRQIARALGLVHHVDPLPADFLSAFAHQAVQLGDGMSSVYHAHNCLPYGRAALFLSGHYSDFSRIHFAEVVLGAHAGTPWQQACNLGRQVVTGQVTLHPVKDEMALFDRLIGKIWYNVTPLLARDVLLPDVAEAMTAYVYHSVAEQLAALPGQSAIDRLMTFNLAHRQRRFTNWGNKMGSVTEEFRLPFCDYDLVDFLLTLPAATRRNLQLDVIRDAAPALTAIPRTPTGVRLDASRLGRGVAFLKTKWAQLRQPGNRQSFGDPQHCLRHVSRGFYEELLLDPATLANGFFDPDGVRRLLRSHMDGLSNQANAICSLATFELWRRTLGSSQNRTVVPSDGLPVG